MYVVCKHTFNVMTLVWSDHEPVVCFCFFLVSTPLATALLYENDHNKARFAGLHCSVSALRKHLFVLAIVKEQLLQMSQWSPENKR